MFLHWKDLLICKESAISMLPAFELNDTVISLSLSISSVASDYLDYLDYLTLQA